MTAKKQPFSGRNGCRQNSRLLIKEKSREFWILSPTVFTAIICKLKLLSVFLRSLTTTEQALLSSPVAICTEKSKNLIVLLCQKCCRESMKKL